MTVVPTEADQQAERPAFLGPDLSADENAPYGYMIDTVTGARRPKKKPGRGPVRPRGEETFRPDGGSTTAPPGPPSLDELRARAPKGAAAPDRPPGARQDGRGRFRAPKAPVDVPPFRAGPIAKGMNKLYVKAGKLIRVADPMVGNAVIACTRKALIINENGDQVLDPDDVTVGEAWEELARTNPRIRAFLLRLISGGAWTQLFMAHAPIFLAVLMKDGIRQRIPFGRLMTALLDDEDQYAGGQDWDEQDEGPVPSPADLSSMLSGLTADDVAQMSSMFGGMMSQMAGRIPTDGMPRTPTVDEPPDAVP